LHLEIIHELHGDNPWPIENRFGKTMTQVGKSKKPGA
jgi:hypothetical protein